MENTLKERHQSVYQKTPDRLYFSPGRANLIGEHTDYSGGYVLPVSISLGIHAAVSSREDKKIRVYSEDFKESGVMTAEKGDGYVQGRGFMNYIEGILHVLREEGKPPLNGFSITLMSTLPKSAGLSSSAALEVLILTILNEECALGLDKASIAKLARKVENTYIGVSSGIMDQFAVALGKKDHALLLDTESLDCEHIPLDLARHTLVMMNTHKSRDLVDSAYNERFRAVERAKDHFTRPLGKVSLETFEKEAPAMEATLQRRLRHVVSENKRTLEAKDALLKGDYVKVGSLMNASHDSLKNLFEVSCAELDYLVDWHRAHGALGARMTGAGFGGTMIALYEKKDVPDFDGLASEYAKRFALPLGVYMAQGADGAKRMGGER